MEASLPKWYRERQAGRGSALFFRFLQAAQLSVYGKVCRRLCGGLALYPPGEGKRENSMTEGSFHGAKLTCPNCGKVVQECRMADAVLICPRCGHRFYSNVYHDLMVQIPVSMTEDKEVMDGIMSLVHAVQKHYGITTQGENKRNNKKR